MPARAVKTLILGNARVHVCIPRRTKLRKKSFFIEKKRDALYLLHKTTAKKSKELNWVLNDSMSHTQWGGDEESMDKVNRQFRDTQRLKLFLTENNNNNNIQTTMFHKQAYIPLANYPSIVLKRLIIWTIKKPSESFPLPTPMDTSLGDGLSNFVDFDFMFCKRYYLGASWSNRVVKLAYVCSRA